MKRRNAPPPSAPAQADAPSAHASEAELKLTLPGADPARVAEQLAQLGLVAGLPVSVQRLTNTYFDTPSQALQTRLEPVKTQLVALFNVSTNYEQFLAAALVPALIHVLAMTAGAWSVGRELRDRTVAQWLGAQASPTQVLSALLGKLAVAFVPLWAVTLACLLYLAQLRGWAVAGSMGWISAGLAALVAVSLAAGAALAGVTLSLRTALSGAGLLSAPAFAFSGVAYPLLAMGEGARTWALAMPYTHYARLQLEQWQMGAPVAQSLPVVAGLGLATLVLLAVATAGLARGLRLPQRWGGR